MGYITKNLKKTMIGALTVAIFIVLALIFIDWGFVLIVSPGARILIVVGFVIGTIVGKEVYNFINYGVWNTKDYD